MATLKTPQPARHPKPTVKAQELAYLIFARRDLDATERFLTDFGLRVVMRTEERIYLRGTNPSPFCYEVRLADEDDFVGFGLAVKTRVDLQKLAALPGASQAIVQQGPGGGEMVRLQDPEGFVVEAIHGRKAVEALAHRAAIGFNTADAAPRVNDTQRPPVLPPEVIRLGHLVLEAPHFQDSCAWYTRHFGFIPSDVQVLADGEPVVTFLRLDLGNTPADHHTLALGQGLYAKFSHCAFELVDADAVGMGQRVLREGGYRHSWGIGRHILGSQIFDYWRDPAGAEHEHYTDGDLFTADYPTGISLAGKRELYQWGPPVPAKFGMPELTAENVRKIAANLRKVPDLSVKKLINMAKAFA